MLLFVCSSLFSRLQWVWCVVSLAPDTICVQLKRFYQRPGCPKAKQEEDTSYGFYAVFPLRITSAPHHVQTHRCDLQTMAVRFVFYNWNLSSNNLLLSLSLSLFSLLPSPCRRNSETTPSRRNFGIPRRKDLSTVQRREENREPRDGVIVCFLFFCFPAPYWATPVKLCPCHRNAGVILVAWVRWPFLTGGLCSSVCVCLCRSVVDGKSPVVPSVRW